jgi:Flp pilus assembly protein TadB
METRDILNKYSAKLESEINIEKSNTETNFSSEYQRFKQDMIPEISKYERLAKSLGNVIKIKVAEKDRIRIQKQLDSAHLETTPSEAMGLALFSSVSVFLATVSIALAIVLLNPAAGFPTLFLLLGIIACMFVFYYAYSMPQRLANAWRLRASSEMVPAILYIVVYMKHTSNLERAIEFASEHLEGPLALDLKKVLYNVEIGKFSTIKESIDYYLESWREYSPEFLESFHLVESSLYEPSESRRVNILEKSLQVILDGIYEKMLKYTREIRSPLTNIYMLGIILPTLGLAMLPLASTLLGGLLQWQHVFVIFNIIIPFMVFYMTSEVLLKRPGGYGESSVLELNPNYQQYSSNKPWVKSAIIVFPLLIIGFIPFIFQINSFTDAFSLKSDYTFRELGISMLGDTKIFDFKMVEGSLIGPFGPLAILCSLFIPLSIAFFFILTYKEKTRLLIKAREDTKLLESEFTNSLFQLGNRIGDGIPAEIAFAKVAESTQGQKTHDFFSLVNQNIQQLGLSLDNAIFDKKRGAIIFYPSSLISTSMKILVESVKKGLQVAARSLMSISEYVKNIAKINERLKDLLAEIISDMKSNMTFLAPLLAGIVVGLASMITSILNKLQITQTLGGSTEISGISMSSITQLFDVTKMIPPYYIQISIGVYIIEIIFILTVALVTVDSGKDPLKEKYDLALNLKTGILLYLGIAFISILALTLLASIALSGI